jgi:uncharacterized membrane protein
MKKLFFALATFTFLLCLPRSVFAQSPSDIYTKGVVTEVLSEEEITQDDRTHYIQTLEVERTDTREKVQIQSGSQYQPIDANKRMSVGQTIVISQQEKTPGEKEWVLLDTSYRLPILLALTLGFFVLVLLVARLQGLLSILGMIISFIILSTFIVPQILAGANPVLISMVSAIVIAAASMYLSHGINLKSHIAYGSILGTLTLVALLTTLVLRAAHMSGTGSEDAVFLLLEPALQMNLRGLLLAGIMLGTLGVLDDICISQISLIQELIHAKPHIELKELITRGLSVGKDHIASLVNTLVLAYAGASLPLFLLFSLYNTQPWWVVLNSEMIAEEIVRTITGSIGLVLAVPIATILASVILLKRKQA